MFNILELRQKMLICFVTIFFICIAAEIICTSCVYAKTVSSDSFKIAKITSEKKQAAIDKKELAREEAQKKKQRVLEQKLLAREEAQQRKELARRKAQWKKQAALEQKLLAREEAQQRKELARRRAQRKKQAALEQKLLAKEEAQEKKQLALEEKRLAREDAQQRKEVAQRKAQWKKQAAIEKKLLAREEARQRKELTRQKAQRKKQAAIEVKRLVREERNLLLAEDAAEEVSAYIVIDKSSYLNTVSIIKDARMYAEAGKNSDALALYKYADEVVDTEKEPILKRKISIEKERVQKIVGQEVYRRESQRLRELERQQAQQIKELYAEGCSYYREDWFDQAENIFKEIISLDVDYRDAQDYIDKLIPHRIASKSKEDQFKQKRQQKLDERRIILERKRKKSLDRKVKIQKEREHQLAQKLALAGLKRRKQEQTQTPAAVDRSEQPRVRVREIRFSGNSVFDSESLKESILSDLGKEYTLDELRLLADRAAQYYHDGGYFLTQVIIPQQDIDAQKGVVNFVVLEGRLGEIVVCGNNRYSEERIRPVLAKVFPGEPIRKQSIERALLVLNSYSGLKTSSVFQDGRGIGTTNINIDVAEKKRIEGSLEVNNFGLKSTGKYRISPELNFNNLTGRGDLLNAKWIKAVDVNDMYYAHLNYMTPVGSQGLQLKSYVSKSSFAVGEEFAPLDIESDVLSWGLGVSYPYLLTQKTSMSFESWFESKDFEQTMLAGLAKTSDDHIRKLRVELFNLDTRSINGRTLLSLGVHQGLGEGFGGMPHDSLRSSRSFAKADNRFTKVTPSIVRAQKINDRLMLVGRVSGQYSFHPLVAGEQWPIGGVNSVHGHQSAVYLGDDGFTANIETRITLLSAKKNLYQLLFFGDHGMIHIQEPTFSQRSKRNISGVGVGIYTGINDMFDIRMDWGIPVGPSTGDNSVFYFEIKYKF